MITSLKEHNEISPFPKLMESKYNGDVYLITGKSIDGLYYYGTLIHNDDKNSSLIRGAYQSNKLQADTFTNFQGKITLENRR
jgi:hypothetical protein